MARKAPASSAPASREVLYGALTAFLEPLSAYPGGPAGAATPSFPARCPHCDEPWGAAPHEDADGAGWRRLSGNSRKWGRPILEDLACSGLWLAETFRGPQGWERLARWLATNEVLSPTETVQEVLAWPRPEGGFERQVDLPAHLARPTLEVETDQTLVVIAHQPPAPQRWRPLIRWYEACEHAGLLKAQRLGKRLRFVLLADESSSAAPSLPMRRLPWSSLVNEEERAEIARTSPVGFSLERWLDDALPLSGTIMPRGLEEAFADGDRSDAGVRFLQCAWPIPNLLDNMVSLGGGGSRGIACRGCGANRLRGTLPSREHLDRVRFLYENPAFADILAEWTAAPRLRAAIAQRWGHLGDRPPALLCWPRMRPRPDTPRRQGERVTTPDALMLGEKCVVSFEAKSPMKGKRLQWAETARELLVRAAHAHTLASMTGASAARLVFVQRETEPDADWVAEQMVREFKRTRHQITHWKAADTEPALFDADHPFCQKLSTRPEALGEMLECVSWRELARLTESAAEVLAKSDGPAYGAISARARGFWQPRA